MYVGILKPRQQAAPIQVEALFRMRRRAETDPGDETGIDDQPLWLRTCVHGQNRPVVEQCRHRREATGR